MKATFAFLADREIYNLVRSISWEAHQNYGIGLDVSRLEPHVSLKQPFEVQDFPALIAYMKELAASIPPFMIHLSGIQAIPVKVDGLETGILWLDLEQSADLKAIHHRLNHELEALFGPSPADHDGEGYHFHMTIAIGNQPFAVYQATADSYQQTNFDLHFMTRELAMFVYEQTFNLQDGYMTYKKLPLGSV